MIFGYPLAQYVDSQGQEWLPATEFVARTSSGFHKGVIADSVSAQWLIEPATQPITGTPDPPIYQYGAHATEFWANVTVGPGKYHVTIKLAERRPPADDPLMQTLAIQINGKTMVDNLDIAGTAGGRFKAVDIVFNDMEPRAGIIEVRFSNQHGGEAVVQALEVGRALAALV